MKLKFKGHVEEVIPAQQNANVISNPGIGLYIYPETMQTENAGLLSDVAQDSKKAINDLLYKLLDSRLPLTVTIEVG